eukprot:jgi/Galph1/3318/GphlegSOOS_G1982.1
MAFIYVTTFGSISFCEQRSLCPPRSRHFRSGLFIKSFSARKMKKSLLYKRNGVLTCCTNWRNSTDLVIIGGGLIGLSCAWEAVKLGAKVTVVTGKESESATIAAAGMLAPQGERLNDGPLLQLCLSSRSLYPAFVEEIETVSGLKADFCASGFICPALEGDAVATFHPPKLAGRSQWLSSREIHTMEPFLGDRIIGGWWFPEDCHVNNVMLYYSLKAACEKAGVRFINDFVDSIISANSKVTKVLLSSGKVLSGEKYILANGSWIRRLVPLPIYPQKGQMIILQDDSERIFLQRVIYGEKVYIVPRKNKEIVVGATIEDDCVFDFQNTAGGVHQLLSGALEMIPSLSNIRLCRTFSGFRPTAPDLLPIFGKLWYDNLHIAAGHHRNGILLTPISGKIVSRMALDIPFGNDLVDSEVLRAFSVERYIGSDGIQVPEPSKVRNGIKAESNATQVAYSKSQSTGFQATKASSEIKTPQQNDKSEVKVWQVTKNGELLPVYYKQPPSNIFGGGYGDFADQFVVKRSGNSINGVNEHKDESSEEMPTKLTSSGNWSQDTDAYLDISSGVRESDYDEELRKSIRANRQFSVSVDKKNETNSSFTENRDVKDKNNFLKSEEDALNNGDDGFAEWLKFYESVSMDFNAPC